MKREITSPRIYEKTSRALLEFLEAGKQGKAVVYATETGNFLSPKAIQNFIRKEKIELLEIQRGVLGKYNCGLDCKFTKAYLRLTEKHIELLKKDKIR